MSENSGDVPDDDNEPDNNEQPARKVGPGNPPHEHRWKKGGPSPNPLGRPRKAQKRKMMEQELELFQKMVLGHANRKVKRTSGDETTMQAATLDRIYELAHDKKNPNFKALKLIQELNERASADAVKLKRDAAKAAFHYKEDVGAQLRKLEAEGKRYRSPVPHPDDIIIDRDLNITIVGPWTEAEHHQMLVNLDKRDTIKAMIPIWLEASDKDFLRDALAFHKRRWEKLDRKLPPRLRQPWPLRPGQVDPDPPA